MPLTIETATAMLETGAYHVELVTPYVARYRTPNTHAAAGYIGNLRFLAVPLARDILAAMPELAGWQVTGYGDDPLSGSEESVRLVNGAARISIHATRTWGANAYARITVDGYTIDSDRRAHTVANFTIGAERAPAAIVKGIRAKILPAMVAVLAKVEAADKAKADAITAIVAKRDSLAKRYPEINFRVSEEQDRIHVSTKVGAKVEIRGAYVREFRGLWGLSSRHCELGIDDIDGADGRAFLRLINEGSR